MVVAVFVVHREQMPRLEVEFSGALGTNESVNLQCLFPIGMVSGGRRFVLKIFEYFVNRFVDCGFLESSQFVPTPVGTCHGVRLSKRWCLYSSHKVCQAEQGRWCDFRRFIGICQCIPEGHSAPQYGPPYGPNCDDKYVACAVAIAGMVCEPHSIDDKILEKRHLYYS